MEGFLDTATQLCIDWGYWGLFLSAFVAGSIVPFSSEAVMVVLVRLGLDPALCLLAAATGNTAGGMTCYWIGHLGKREWFGRYLGIGEKQLDRAGRFPRRKGGMERLFSPSCPTSAKRSPSCWDSCAATCGSPRWPCSRARRCATWLSSTPCKAQYRCCRARTARLLHIRQSVMKRIIAGESPSWEFSSR